MSRSCCRRRIKYQQKDQSISALFFILFSIVSWAGPFTFNPSEIGEKPCDDWSPADFRKPYSALQDWGLKQKVAKASVNFSYPTGGKSRAMCSASQISDSGHILTASHCIEDCFRLKKLPVAYEQKVDKYLLARYVPRPLKCPITIGRKTVQAEVVLANPCTQRATHGALVDLQKGVDSGEIAECATYGDIAILKVPGAALKDTTCLPLATRQPAVGEALAMLSYPNKTARRAHNSDGVSQYFSSGHRVRQNFCTRTRGSQPEQVPLDKVFASVARVRYQLTLDGIHGSSGGPILNRQGQVVGVYEASSPVQNAAEECRGANLATPTTYLAANRAAWNPKFNLRDLKCDQKSALK